MGKINLKYKENLGKASMFLRWCISSKVDEIVERFRLNGSVLEFKKRIIKVEFVTDVCSAKNMVKRKWFRSCVMDINKIAEVLKCKVKFKISIK